MKKLFIGLLCLTGSLYLQAQPITTLFEETKGAKTPEYAAIIRWWQQLDKRSDKVRLLTMGPTDAGFPLHLAIVSANGDTSFERMRRQNKRIILINNGIHPGEPDGIDASMLLARDIAAGKYKLPGNIVLAIIPVYNIGGCLNRSANYRVDQDGPDEFGSRGNSQNLDLNRDFVKNDSREARSFAEIFHKLDPDVFVDNHVSNGADYQHVMTLLASQHNKIGGEMGIFMNQQFEPGLYRLMKEKGFDLVPYVNHWSDKKVEEGWQAFWDSPRYGSGYGTLWQAFSFVPETHMLKPYPQRVAATYALMQSFIEFTASSSSAIKQAREKDREAVKNAARFPVSWQWEPEKKALISFKGYESGYKPSEVSGLPRLYYDRSRPYTREIPFYNYYREVEFVEKPRAYVIPQGWWKVIDLLKINKVAMRPLARDTLIEVEVYYIDSYRSSPAVYEGHHLNSNVRVRSLVEKVGFRKGDWYIPLNQAANRFLVEVLDPRAEDSYFAWNFFDGILRQKEGFSDYAFEDIAAGYLRQHPELHQQLEEKRGSDTAFAKSAYQQLNFVYQHSPYFEPDYLRYPVYRVR